jgi:Neuraminidase (sialidase)
LHSNAEIYQNSLNNGSFKINPTNSFPDDIQAAMAKQHHQLLDGSFMPETSVVSALID